jgi:hypothetical protein
MTQLTLSMLLRAEGAPAAKAAIQEVASSTERLGSATTRGAAAERAAATAKQANARAARELQAANASAAGATGNLFAQFQDIGVMMAAGQNPLQLAVQQGSQIVQVIGPMGAAGAVGALKNAFLSLLNPLNFVTIGLIAAGAAAFQWLTGAADETMSFADSVDQLSDRADSFVQAIGRARMSTAELRGEFGESSREIRKLLQDMAELELRETQRAARQASVDLQAQIGIYEGPEFGVGNQKNLADMFDLSIWSSEARREINTVLAAFQQLDSAGTLDEQIAAAENLKIKFTEAAMASGEISAAEDAVLAPLNEMIVSLVRVREEQAGTTEEIVRSKNEATGLSSILSSIMGNLNRADGSNLVAAFESAEPAAARLLGMAQGIIATISAAGQFAAAQQKLAADGKVYSGRGGDPRTSNQEGYGRFVYTGPSLDAFNNPIVPGRGGAGGGGAAARDEANALQELITSLEGEIQALRVQDPIQQELLKHREALTGATEAEKQKVEELIATREREKAAIEGLKEVSNMAGNALIDALMGGKDAGEQLIQTLIKAGLQAAILGEGPLGGLFGGKSIFQMIFPALGAGRAGGGRVFGPGDGSKDTFLTPTANGEYIVNARATARNLHLLEAINSGAQLTAGYAAGGMIGSDSRRMAGRGLGGGPSTLVIDVRGAQGNTEIQENIRRAVQTGLQLYDREALPRSVRRVSADQKRVN